MFEQRGHFGRIDVALDDRNGVIDVDRVHAAVVAGQCVSHFRQSRLISGLDVGSGLDTGKTLCMGSRQRVQGLDETDSDELESELRAHFKLSWEALMSRQVSPSSPDLCEALQRRADPLQSRQIRL